MIVVVVPAEVAVLVPPGTVITVVLGVGVVTVVSLAVATVAVVPPADSVELELVVDVMPELSAGAVCAPAPGPTRTSATARAGTRVRGNMDP